MEIIDNIANWFINPVNNEGINKQRKIRFLIFIQLFILFVLFLTLIIQFSFQHNIYLSVLPSAFILILNLGLYKKTKNYELSSNIFVFFLYLALFSACIQSGGVFSDDLYWFLLIPLLALLLNEIKNGLIWAGIVSVNSIFLYVLELRATETYRQVTLENNADYYMTGSVLFFFTIIGIVSIFKKQSNNFEKKLNDQRLELITQKNLLKVQAKRLEETQNALKESNIELEKYAYITSHDLKQPLRTVKSFTGLLEKRLLAKNLMDNEIYEYIDYVMKSSTHMEELINSLLEYAKVSSSTSIEYVQMDLNKTIEVVKQNLSHQITQSNATIIIDKLPEISAIPVKINQLFQNIISNGIKFAKLNIPPVIQISAGNSKDYWEFRISDNGIGLNDKDVEKIFLPFERSSNSNSASGSGIGLATCKKIVELHKGKIEAISEGEGKGSCIVFTIKKHLGRSKTKDKKTVLT